MLRGLGQPMVGVALRRLKTAYQAYQADKNVEALLELAEELAQVSSDVEDRMNTPQQSPQS